MVKTTTPAELAVLTDQLRSEHPSAYAKTIQQGMVLPKDKLTHIQRWGVEYCGLIATYAHHQQLIAAAVHRRDNVLLVATHTFWDLVRDHTNGETFVYNGYEMIKTFGEGVSSTLEKI